MMNYLEKVIRLFNLTGDATDFGYDEKQLISLEARLDIKLPKSLRAYYLAIGTNAAVNESHNRLLKPSGGEIGFSQDKHLVFYEENQASACWGIKNQDLGLDNPPVWGNYGSDDDPDWHQEAKTTEDFFLLMALSNGTLGGLTYHANSFEMLRPKTVEKIKKEWVELADLSWEKQKMYTRDFDAVISLNFNDNAVCTGIFVGTSHRKHYSELLDLDVNWSYSSH